MRIRFSAPKSLIETSVGAPVGDVTRTSLSE